MSLETVKAMVYDFFYPNKDQISQVSNKDPISPIVNKISEDYIETSELKTVRLGLNTHLENFRMLTIAALLATVATTLFFSFFTIVMGGLTGALLTYSLLALGALGGTFCYDVMKTCEKGVEIASNAKNFVLLNVAQRLEHRELFFNQCRTLIQKAVDDTLLFKYAYTRFADKFWALIKEEQLRRV